MSFGNDEVVCIYFCELQLEGFVVNSVEIDSIVKMILLRKDSFKIFCFIQLNNSRYFVEIYILVEFKFTVLIYL